MIVSIEQRRELNDRQREILRVIVARIVADGMQPSLAEIGDALGMSAQSVHYQIREISARGWLDAGGGARALSIPVDVRESFAPVADERPAMVENAGACR